ncbi:MAG: aminotransferase class III-fold pyridoxal phosphate-dependent enzyme [Candidatus Thermoplasmatota archaeon]|nr:aminotransferase class III-fold pyridoxal phosphate-dependent enzyme [Candidatus Thermoplasmatota archaeon]
MLIFDSAEHPERTNATLERVCEVLDNVLEGEAARVTARLRERLGDVEPRKPLSEKQADVVVDVFDRAELARENWEDLIRQLEYSEISTAEAIDVHRALKIPVSHLEEDVVPVKGQGCWILDSKGRWYLDMDSNYSATNLGMANGELARGLYNQARLLVSMKEDRVQIARTRFLKEIGPMMPPGLDHFYWQNSGGEAVDKCLKFAKAYTGTRDVIAFKNGFHGRTHGAVAVTWNRAYREPFGLADEKWVHFADFNDADSVHRLMDQTDAKIIIMEMVQGEEGGNLPAQQEFIDDLWELAKERHAVIIDDEVQAGFGRTAVEEGDWFACHSYGVVPDIMAIGKSFGGGYPVTAVVTSQEISSAMQPGWDGSTFGGNPMAMTAALIATRQMRRHDITGNVIDRTEQMSDGLRELQKKHPVMDDIRGRGLMLAFSVGSPENVSRLQQALHRKGVKSSLSTGPYIRFLPPTVISPGEVDVFLQRLDGALAELT